MKRLEQDLSKVKTEYENIERANKAMTTKIKDLTSAKKKAEDAVHRLENVIQPKIKKAYETQKDINNALTAIKQDSELLPSMFRKLVEENEKSKLSEKEAKLLAEDAASSKGKLESKIKDLENETARKKQLAMQAVAARGEIKRHLDESLATIEQMKLEKEHLLQDVKNAQEDMLKYQQKHDEMFESVNSLNSRIEELEEHKLHLLNKLKALGDKGDLDYIIKTQKLENVKHKGFESRVQVEDYNPQ